MRMVEKKGSGGAGTDIHMFVDHAGVEVAWLWARLKCKLSNMCIILVM
jgi:hypothetical protein